MTEYRFRASPHYEFVRLDHLTAPERRALADAGEDPDTFGILRPRDPSLGTKCVSRDTALLWLLLQRPDTLPAYALTPLGDRRDDFIRKLVFDGVLEVEAGGRTVSGPDALTVLCEPGDVDVVRGSLPVLSRRAIAYAAALNVPNAAVLSARLYAFNRVPLSPYWRRLLPNEEAVVRFSRLCDVAVPAHWVPVDFTPGTPWMAWQSHNWNGADARAAYKLYVSPACADMREAIPAAAEAIFTSPAVYWKLGNDASGLLRPDKFVAYFSRFADLQETAASVLEKLRGCAAHGTPFTADLGGSGLLSWGVDPNAQLGWFRGESWRGLICNRLAAALVLAQTAPAAQVLPEDFAMERLRLEGIDTYTWAASNHLSWM